MTSILDEGYPIIDKGCELTATVRHKSCELIVTSDGIRCKVCSKYRSVLRSIYYNYIKSSRHDQNAKPKANMRFLTTPKRSKHIKSLKLAIRRQKRQIKLLQKWLEEATVEHGVDTDELLTSDIDAVVQAYQNEVSALPETDFKRIFWEQQVK